MTRNKLITLIASLTVLVALAGSSLLVPTINAQRSDLNLVYSADVTRNLPPKMALLRTFLGSFKSIVANALWMRAESLKQDGKFHEAMELAQLISDLQPRFSEVWSFLSWNMAYNISVATHTERERWMWVNRGIALLRDKGIPANPMSTKLYRQLGWTFLHKVGQFSDDMHWYYKQKLAERWQLLLGRPDRGLRPKRDADGEPVVGPDGEAAQEYGEIAAFRPIALMDQQFFADDVLDRRIRERLIELASASPELADRLDALRLTDPFNFDRAAARAIGRIEPRYTDVHEALAQMRAINRRMLDRMQRDPDKLLAERYPEAAAALALLGDLDYELNKALLLDIGRARMRIEARQLGYPVGEPPAEQAAKLEALEAWLGDDDPRAADVRDRIVMPYLRAKVLRRDYHMRPTFVMELMDGRWLARTPAAQPQPVPLDFRHPAAHGLYWSALGVLVGQDRRARDEDYHFTMLNTDRQVIHALQALTHNGSVALDPYTGHYAQLPDPRFINGYLQAVESAYDRIDPANDKPGVIRSFEAGMENFLAWAVRLCYFWGAPDKAEQLYQRLGREFRNKPGRMERYSQTLDQFIAEDIREDIKSLDEARKVIGGLINTAFEQGYVNGRADVARARMDTARQAYRYYQENQARFTPNASRERMGLRPFGQMAADVLADFMTKPHGPRPQGVPLPMKELLWRHMPMYTAAGEPNELKQRVWDRIRPTLYAQVEWFNQQAPRRGGRDADALEAEKLFPAPPNMTEYRKAHGLPEPDAAAN